MTRKLAILFSLMLLVSCGRKAEMGSGLARVAPIETKIVEERSRTLAYEHGVELETDEDHIQDVFERALASCKEAVAAQCEVLESRLNTAKFSSASVRLRAAPEGIQLVLSKLDQHGKVISRRTSAEDLATPIEDGGRKLAMLNDYRGRLEDLRSKAGTNVDALIKVNQELARVQSELEAVAGDQARLTKRVKTEVLNLSIGTSGSHGFWRTILESLTDFGTNLAQGIASTVTGVAFLLPWLVVLVPVVLLLKKFLWRKRSVKA